MNILIKSAVKLYSNSCVSISSLKMAPNAYLSYFKKLKEKYLEKNPREKWMLIRNINSFLMKFIDLNFMEFGYKITFKTFIPAFLSIKYFLCALYTLYYYRNEPSRSLQATVVSGLIIPVSFFFHCK